MFGLAQQVVAPVQRRSQRLLAGFGRPVAAGQQLEGIFEALGDLLHRQRPEPRRSQLYGQGYPIEFAAHSRHHFCVLVGQLEGGQPRAGAVHEEPHRFVAHQALGGGCLIHIRQGEGRHRPEGFSGDAKGFPAGGEDAQFRTGS